MTELLPCPFCGGPVAVSTYDRRSRTVYCDNCNLDMDVELDQYDTDERAMQRVLKQWNTRADAALLDRLHTAEAEREILRSFKAGVPWASIAYAALHLDLAHIKAHGSPDPQLSTVFAWLNANTPQEPTP